MKLTLKTMLFILVISMLVTGGCTAKSYKNLGSIGVLDLAPSGTGFSDTDNASELPVKQEKASGSIGIMDKSLGKAGLSGTVNGTNVPVKEKRPLGSVGVSDMAPGEAGFSGIIKPVPKPDNPQDNVSPVVAPNRKIVKTAYISVETLDFDKAADTITGTISSIGGYIENSNRSGVKKDENSNIKRKAHFEIRVPSKDFEDFISKLGELGTINNEEIRGEDVTGQYYDTETRLKTLKVQEERILKLLSEAESLQDIITLEQRLSDIRYQIEYHTGALQKWDNMVDYRKVVIDLYEVKEIKEEVKEPATLWQRMKSEYLKSTNKVMEIIKECLVSVARSIPYIAVISVLLLALKMISKRK